MRIQPFSAWATSQTVTINPSERPYCGLAIGPGSHEGLVIVDDFPLQAGRVLPIRSDKYTIKKVRPNVASSVFANPDTALDCIQHLELILFDDPGELGAVIPRANGHFAATLTATGALAKMIAVPFVGRRQALFVIGSDDLAGGTFSYTVFGGRYERSSRTIVRYPLHVAAAVNLNLTHTIAFYVGGMDNAEVWDFLELYVGVANGKHFYADVETLGELGAY